MLEAKDQETSTHQVTKCLSDHVDTRDHHASFARRILPTTVLVCIILFPSVHAVTRVQEKMLVEQLLRG